MEYPSTAAPGSAGCIAVPAFDLPPSAALSEIARKAQASRGTAGGLAIPRPTEFDSEETFKQAVLAFRQNLDIQLAQPLSDAIYSAYPVRIEQTSLANVPVEIFSPSGECVEDRVLINLHGGAFCAGAIYIGRVESIPLCYLGGWKVISVNYRQGFEHKHPAACEDVAAVYSELLKTYPANHIGIFGGSAGGTIASQTVAWLIENDVPVPGALGVFGAGTGGGGDSSYFGAIGTGQKPPFDLFGSLMGGTVGYFSDVQSDDYMVNPNLAPESFRAHYPPTLLITGTRAFDLSPAIAMHRALVAAGVEASLHVFDGLGHSFYYDISLPESQDAYATMNRFFRDNLGDGA